jgi:glutamine cyclotransferase
VGRATLVGVIALLAAGCTAQPATGTAPNRLHAEVLATMAHDTTAFTEGLELADGLLYEGTGLKGSSTMRVVDPATGAVRQRSALPDDLFGEGITVTGPTIWQLTWQDGVAIQRDRATLAEKRRVSYSGEGWGLCLDAAANRLVMSDGTDKLTFRDPDTFQETGSVRVTMAGRPVTQINELECAHGAVYANIWKTDSVVRIDPASGTVTDEINLAGLLPAADRAHADVLNGIAAIPGTDEFLVTGKYWPQMYRVRFVA